MTSKLEAIYWDEIRENRRKNREALPLKASAYAAYWLNWAAYWRRSINDIPDSTYCLHEARASIEIARRYVRFRYLP
jgi:hypothetical protein